ncbi:hypothetical protein H696_01795 [Fonticula alba]|uniref:Uncharacterized protein n=1 Tax=Fonticula alba TaxID=691883 RepID=A0A058ZDB2_FONAL|nr:hypothetical protein H696_01795 [Fonticula alba]KCV72400.1 hypothetical protein H696_01795 [Fonticula alba]|eukprot:XP_009493978.1 hypothetical protein H696_01795 [Fonticula alba]
MHSLLRWAGPLARRSGTQPATAAAMHQLLQRCRGPPRAKAPAGVALASGAITSAGDGPATTQAPEAELASTPAADPMADQMADMMASLMASSAPMPGAGGALAGELLPLASSYQDPVMGFVWVAERALRLLHDLPSGAGLPPVPWWLTILTLTLVARSAISVPATMWSLRRSHAIERLKPTLDAWQARFSTEMMRDVVTAYERRRDAPGPPPSPKEVLQAGNINIVYEDVVPAAHGIELAPAARKKLVRQLEKRMRKQRGAELKGAGLSHYASPPVMMAVMQIPLWLSVSLALRHMSAFSGGSWLLNAAAGTPDPAFRPAPLPGFTEGGFGPFLDLTVADPSGLLPLATGSVLLLNSLYTYLRKPAGVELSVQMRYVNALSVSGACVIFALGDTLPAALYFYWLSSGVFSLSQQVLLNNPWFRRYVLRVPFLRSERASLIHLGRRLQREGKLGASLLAAARGWRMPAWWRA